MNVRETDRRLAEWDERLATIARNLLELQQEPAYRLLTGFGGSPKITLAGLTAQKVDPSLGALADAFRHFDLLHETISRAKELRHGISPLFFTEERRAQVEHLLSARTICVPCVPAGGEGRATRSLLNEDQREERLSPAELVERMKRTFAGARDAVMNVDAAWIRVSEELDSSQAELARLRTCAGASARADLDGAERELARVHAILKADPLGALLALETRLQPILTRTAKEHAQREQVRRDLLRARGELDRLESTHREALAAAAELNAKISATSAGSGIPPQPLLPEWQLAGLRQWLTRLEERCEESPPEALAVALKNWRTTHASALLQDEAALAMARKPLALRAELRGRMSALKAKARAYGVAEEVAVSNAAGRAEAFLGERPTRLDEAASAVTAYESLLLQAGRQLVPSGKGEA